jgi:hypothetical protein
MSFLDGYYTEDELVRLLKKKTKKGSKRNLRKMRQRRVGPPWAIVNRVPLYPKNGAADWIGSLIQQPLRSRKRAVA